MIRCTQPSDTPIIDPVIDADTVIRSATVLIGFSVVNAGLLYITSVFLARVLGPAGYSKYIVAIAAVATLSSFAEFGTGKHALRIIPAMSVSRQWSLIAGYTRFCCILVATLGVVVAASAAIVLWQRDATLGDDALDVALLFLPVIALFGMGVEFLISHHAALTGFSLSRLFVPSMALGLMGLGSVFLHEFNAAWAAGCLGAATTLGLVLTVGIYLRRSPREVLQASPTYQFQDWMKGLVALTSLIFLASWVFKISIVILDWLPIAHLEVARFAAAMETGSLILVLSKSTNKFFQPQISLIVAGRDWEGATRIRKQRYVLVGSICGVFLFTMVFFGQEVLSLFGPEFRDGYAALCLVSVATCTWTMFSLAPAYLRFVGLVSYVFLVALSGAVALSGLTYVLGSRFGATGAAIAFCIVVVAMAVTLLVLGNLHFARMRARTRTETESETASRHPQA